MLKLCTKNEIYQYTDFAYGLAKNPSKSAYPTYNDGIKTKEMFIEQLEYAFDSDTEEILLFEYEGKVEGLIQYYWKTEDNYIGTNLFNVNKAMEQALAEFLMYLGERFKGYELFLGFPGDNSEAIEYLSEREFECIENDYNNTAFIDKIDVLPDVKGLTRINKENYECFKILHDQIEGDMYWNSERILNDLDNWCVFVAEKEGIPKGAVYYTSSDDEWFEIYGIDFDKSEFNCAVHKDLLKATLNDVRNKGGKIVTFFCDEEAEQATIECGFTCVGKYYCFKVLLDV